MRRLVPIVPSLSAAVLLAGCASAPVTPVAPLFPPGYVAAWQAAVVDARNPTPDKIDPHLTPIEGNPDHIRKTIDGKEHVLVVSWKSERGEKYDTEQLGYPWTQLGYTYDWHPGNESHRGLSEFVIKPNADVYVAAEPDTLDYCTSDNPIPGAQSP